MTEKTITDEVPAGLALDPRTLAAVQAAATSAWAKHGDHSMFGPISNGDRLAILMEEVGDELTYDQPGDKDKLVKELLQVSAMAASWAEYADGGAS